MVLFDKDESQKTLFWTKEANRRRVYRGIQFIKVQNKKNYTHAYVREHIHTYTYTYTYIRMWNMHICSKGINKKKAE